MDREIAIELADFLDRQRQLAESRRDFIIKQHVERDLSTLHEHIAKLAQWEKLVREAAVQ